MGKTLEYIIVYGKCIKACMKMVYTNPMSTTGEKARGYKVSSTIYVQ